MRFQFWTLLVYTLDALLVAWLCQGKLVGQYLVVANLFSKLRLLLQSADEAVWPILAAKTQKAELIADGVLRFNGWLWGGAMAVSAVCIPAFIAHYKTEDFSGGTLLTSLFALRYLITGIASHPGYWMFGHGHMDLLARLMRRELACCLAFSVPLGLWLGPTGILLAFIAGSSGSTLLPLHFEFAKASGQPLWTKLRASWSRAALSAGLAATLSFWGLRHWGGDWRLTVALAGFCLATTLGVAFGAALIRARRAGCTGRAELGRFL
jgi:O-antigen/teichoic acid export membrane protein